MYRLLIATAIAASLTLAVFPAPSSMGQDSPGTGGANEKDDSAPPRIVQGEEVMISWSEDNDELRGFSRVRGQWRALPIDPEKDLNPIVGGDVAGVVVGQKVAAFSAHWGRWDVLTLSDDWDREENPVVVQRELVQVQDGDHLYTFASSTGRWTSPTDDEYQAYQSLYKLKHVSSRDVHRKVDDWLSAQNPADVHGGANFTGDKVTIFSNRKSWKDSFEQFLKSVDVPENAQPAAAGTNRRSSATRDPKVEDLRQQLQRLERESAAAARELQDTNAPTAEQRSRLDRLVGAAFDARQKLQLSDVERMEKKLQTIKDNLEARQKNRSRIVERRVEELLDPDGTLTGWNNSLPHSEERAAPDRLPAFGKPIGLPGPPHIPRGTAPSEIPSAQERLALPNLLGSSAEPDWRVQTDLAARLRSLQNDVRQSQAALEDAAEQKKYAEALLEQETESNDETAAAKREAALNQLEALKSLQEAHQANLDAARASWQSFWAAYEGELRLKKLDVDEAQAVLQPLQADLERTQALFQRGLTSSEFVQKAEAEVAVAKIQLERAEQVLATLKGIVEREPGLKPDDSSATSP